ncbi:hypothetical protein ACFQ4O_14230, partial [Methylopila musalis]
MARNAAERSATVRIPAQSPLPNEVVRDERADARPALRPVEVSPEPPAAGDAATPAKPARAKRA